MHMFRPRENIMQVLYYQNKRQSYGKIVHTQRSFIKQPTHRQTHYWKAVTSKYLTHPTALLTNPHPSNFTALTTPSILSAGFQNLYNAQNNSENSEQRSFLHITQCMLQKTYFQV